MESLGRYLQEERERQGKTLHQITERTRISRTMLQAIESGRQEELPAASFLRGLIKLYAQELGLNEDDVLARLPSTAAQETRLGPLRTISITPSRKPRAVLLALVLLVLCAVCIWAWKMLSVSVPPVMDPTLHHAPAVSDVTETDSERQLHADDRAEQGMDIPAVSLDLQPQAEAVEEESVAVFEPFEVQFTARRIVWIRLQANDRQPHEITLRPGEVYRTTAEDVLHVRVGDPNAVEIRYNNTPVAMPGIPGVPLNMVFPDDIRTEPPDAA